MNATAITSGRTNVLLAAIFNESNNSAGDESRNNPFVPGKKATSGTGAAPGLRNIWRDAASLPLMISLPAGEFWMGENAGDKFANDTERPAHRVCVAAGFAIACFPVTTGEFRCFRPGHLPADADELPVVDVSWADAQGYCAWLSARTGRRYRLPSEAEWEFACRAGSPKPFTTGDEISVHAANYLYDESGVKIGVGRRTLVADYPPNAFGVYDLHGNVCEWVADNWHPDYHGAPADGQAWTQAENTGRVIRGGAWDYLPRLLRSSWRDWRPEHYRADNLGFRVVAEPNRDRT